MKKLLFIGVLCLLFTGTLNAQIRPYKLLENTSISFGGGVNTYNSNYHKMFKTIGFGGEVSFSKWVSNCIGFRVQFGLSQFQNEGLWGPSHYTPEELADPNFEPGPTGVYNVTSFTADMSILFDPFHTMLRRFNPAKPRGYFICGLGYIGANGGEYASGKDFLTYLAYHQEIGKFGKNPAFAWTLYIEPKAMLLQPEVLGNVKSSLLVSASAGFSLKFNPVLKPSMYRPRRVASRSKFWAEDWYLGIGASVSSLRYKGLSSFEQYLRQTRPAIQLTVGKYNSPCISTRLQCEIGGLGIEDMNKVENNHSRTVGYIYTHADVAFNVSKMVRNKRISSRGTLQNTNSSYRIGRPHFWNRSHFEPFAGLGAIYRFADSWSFAAHAGLRYRYTMSERADFWVELRYTQLMNRFIDGEVEPVTPPAPQSIVSVNYPSLLAGFNFHLGMQNYRH